MNRFEAFSKYNPIVNLIYFIFTIGFTMFIIHPLFLIISLINGILYLLILDYKDKYKYFFSLFTIFIFLSVLNPIVNQNGEKVLFIYFNRKYTLEALLNGFIFSGMFVSFFIYFSIYNTIFSSDKLMYIFNKLIPKTTMIFSIILKLVPSYKNLANEIKTAQTCIGNYKISSLKEKFKSYVDIFLSLIGVALEKGIVSSNSMMSRGYESNKNALKKRSSFMIYKIRVRDVFLSILLLILAIMIIYFFSKSSYKMDFTKLVNYKLDDIHLKYCFISYSLLFFIPTILNILETIRWNNSKSKI